VQRHKFVEVMAQDLFSKFIEMPSAVDIPENAHDRKSEFPKVSSANLDGRSYDALLRTGYPDGTVRRREVPVMNNRSAKRFECAVKASETLL